MTPTLNTRDLISLGFMTFALFLGAGNIIFPPLVGQLSGSTIWFAALGFLLTGVGLPLLAIVALARTGGGLPTITSPMGKVAGLVFGIVVYLTIGPLFATPRTATVSFEIGMVPFVGGSELALAIYSFVFFAVVTLFSLYPGRLLDTVGKWLTPVLMLGLLILALAAIALPAGVIGTPADHYIEQAFSQGFTQGYQTMDALAGLVFGIVIINAITERGITNNQLLTRYTIIAGFIAALGLAAVYVSLIWLGATSGNLAPNAATGAPILNAFMTYAFGPIGNMLLAFVIILACLTTSIGLISSCALYFGKLINLSYRKAVLLLSLISMIIANQGLEQLITIAEPVLFTIYPIAISLIALNLAKPYWQQPTRVFIPTTMVAALFGFIDGLQLAGYGDWLPPLFNTLPGAPIHFGWTTPVLGVLIVSAVVDRLLSRPKTR